jgi:hypothetical protein
VLTRYLGKTRRGRIVVRFYVSHYSFAFLGIIQLLHLAILVIKGGRLRFISCFGVEDQQTAFDVSSRVRDLR